MPLKLLLIAGARPNFMKVAPLIHAIQRHNARLSSVISPPSSVSPLRAGERVAHAPGEVQSPCSSVPISTFSFQLSAFETSSASPSPISYRLLHTGQHYDKKMSEVFFKELGIPAPDFNLGVGSGSHAVQTANIMLKFEPVLLSAFAEPPSVPASPDFSFPLSAFEKSVVGGPVVPSASSRSASPLSTLNSQPSTPSNFSFPLSAFSFKDALPDWLIVVGDVNSTMACTLVASKLGVKIAHVEAGLRSFDRTMPEEINRLVTDSLADLLLTPSDDANENLRREGVAEDKIRLVGNIMVDSLVANLPKARASAILKQLNLEPEKFVYVTLHRPNNVDHRESLSAIMAELQRLAGQMPVVFPMHPRTRKMLADFDLARRPQSSVLGPPSPVSGPSPPRLLLLDPIGYHDSLCLAENARLVLTDSGGLQEETTYFRTPCLTLRPNTERPVTVTLGSNRLTTLSALDSDLARLLAAESRCGQVPPLWDGRAADRILSALIS